MIVLTAKVNKKRIISGLLVLGIIICSAVMIAKRNTPAEEPPAEVQEQEQQTMNTEEKRLKTNEERVSLLEGYGWQVDKEPIEFMEVKIPDEFDGVYADYNEIQKRQGMDLTKYAGKRVMRYTYKVNNHPSKEEGVVANIIVYKNKLIGGDICSPKLGGFMHALSETQEAEKTN